MIGVRKLSKTTLQALKSLIPHSVKYLHESLYTIKKTYREQQHEKKAKARQVGTNLQLSIDAFLHEKKTKPSNPKPYL
jgi:hypothetical protein